MGLADTTEMFSNIHDKSNLREIRAFFVKDLLMVCQLLRNSLQEATETW